MLKKLVLGDVLGALEDVGLGDLAEAELVDVDVGPEGDQTEEGVVGQEINGLRQGGLEEADLFLDDTGVDDEHENRRRRRRRGGVGGGGGLVVLDGGVLGEELGGEVFVGDGGVVEGEVVALEAEGTDPDLGGEVDDGEGVEDGSAGAAAERGVGEDRHGREGLQGSVDGRDGDDAVGRLLLRAWYYVPGHSDPVLALQVQELLRHFLSFVFRLFSSLVSLSPSLPLSLKRGRVGLG